MCVCVCVCARASDVCVCARASDVCVCARASDVCAVLPYWQLSVNFLIAILKRFLVILSIFSDCL